MPAWFACPEVSATMIDADDGVRRCKGREGLARREARDGWPPIV